MLYRITKPIAKFALSAYFRKIYFSNADRIPTDKPVILAANHPTAFIEPCILACWLEEPLHFMARGDFVLKSNFFKNLYEMYNIIPIYRIQDGGFGKLRDNFSAFAAATEFLRKNKMVLILAEGTTVHEKRLRPIKKGVARVAFGSAEGYPDLDIQIVPVGVNYSDSDKMRSLVMIDFGEPIALKDFKEVYEENNNRAIRELTGAITKVLSERVVHIEHRDEEDEVEKLLEYIDLKKMEKTPSTIEHSDELLNYKNRLVSKINNLKKEEKIPLFKALNRLEDACKKLNVSFEGILREGDIGASNFWKLILLFPLFLVGYIGNFLPVWGSGFITKKYITDISFRASTSIALGIVLYLIYWFVLLGIGLAIGNVWLLLGILLLPFLGKIALRFQDLRREFTEGKKLKKLNKTDLKKLREAKAELDMQIQSILNH